MNNQRGTDGSIGLPQPSPTGSLISSFGGSTGEDSGYAGSPLLGTVDPSHLSVTNNFNDFTLFETEPSTNSARFAEDTKTKGSSSQEPVQAKKEVKKRKSWGQPLPEPTTSLPPRYFFPAGH